MAVHRRIYLRGNGQTVGAAVVTLAAFRMPIDHSFSVTSDAVVRVLGGANDGVSNRIRREATVRDIGGVKTIEAQTVPARLGAPLLVTDLITYTLSGAFVLLDATGVAGETLDWMSWSRLLLFQP